MKKVNCLPKEDFEHLAPSVNGRVRANHKGYDCSGSRDSMIIRRTDRGINAHCYRCNRSGFIATHSHYKSPVKAHATSPDSPTVHSKHPPADASSLWHAWPREAREWLLKAGIDSKVAVGQGFVWSDSQRALWLPVRQYSRTTVGWKDVGYVMRMFPKDYRTFTENKHEFFGYFNFDSPAVVVGDERLGTASACPPQVVVLVEDVVSGIRCASSGYHSISLCGVAAKPSVVDFVLKNGYKRVIVFLDGDKPQVKMAARAIVKQFPTLETRIIETGRDPKSYTKAELQEILK